MKLHINPKDGKPIYRQIIEQVKYLIAAGRLRFSILSPHRAYKKQEVES